MRRYADFILALVLLLAAELGVRLFLPHDVSGRFSYGYDQDSGFVEAKDGSVRLVRAGGRRFHPQQFSRQRPAGAFRIMVIGDSVPRGPNLEAAYANQLEKFLQEKGIRAEVINLAIPGFGVRRSQLVVRKVLAYDPDLIILHLNDSNEFEDEREYRRSQDFQSLHPRHWPMKIFILARAYELKTEKIMWRLLPEPIRRQNAVSDADAEVRASLDEATQAVWKQRVRETTRETVALARGQGIGVIVVTQGTLHQGEDGGADRIDDHGLDALGQALTGPGVSLLSMQQVFSALNPLKAYFADSAHLTPRGHQTLAGFLADLIVREHRVGEGGVWESSLGTNRRQVGTEACR